jgi:DNA helicase HerA-like ATPase
MSADTNDDETEGENSLALDDSIDSQPEQTKNLNTNLDFHFVAYDEDLTIVGSKGSGKSYLANTILQSLHGINVWVWDYNRQFHDSKSMLFHDLDEMLEAWKIMKSGKYILQSFDNSETEFRRFCKAAFNMANGGLVVIIDEVHAYVTKQKIVKEYNDIVLSGRPRGITLVSISSRPASLPNNCLTNAKHVFAFRLNLESDVKYLESWMGSEVWVLMPKNKRLKYKDYTEIEEHSFYYRNMDEAEGCVSKI